ncbi:Hypothetical protein CINCED_3A001257 [Cinara cedri]|uniref:Uncharacterized protein n=1 Tax=Cinara cedri TaxID=506608 RepID=A0A5E4M4T2_9HEMI|nr:Hypothetical protein CINCED_3A001257 [Cinara cedri]
MKKFQTMTFAKCRSVISFQYKTYDSTFVSVKSVRLGALNVLGLVKRIASEFRLEYSLKSLYCSLVRSIIEYEPVLWDTHTASSYLQLKRIQRCFLSFAFYVLKIGHAPDDYFPVLSVLNFTLLANRRAAANLSFLHKLLDGSINA